MLCLYRRKPAGRQGFLPDTSCRNFLLVGLSNICAGSASGCALWRVALFFAVSAGNLQRAASHPRRKSWVLGCSCPQENSETRAVFCCFRYFYQRQADIANGAGRGDRTVDGSKRRAAAANPRWRSRNRRSVRGQVPALPVVSARRQTAAAGCRHGRSKPSQCRGMPQYPTRNTGRAAAS